MPAISHTQLQELLVVSTPTLENVHPALRQRCFQLIHKLAEEGLSFGAFMGLRSFDSQRALYAQGREPLALVNALRRKAELGEITEPDNHHIVTTKQVGFHNFGLAVDLVEDGNPDQVGIQWSWSRNADYLSIGKYTKDLGLIYGGFWKSFKDYPHVELTGGLTLVECVTLYKSGRLPGVFAEVTKRLSC